MQVVLDFAHFSQTGTKAPGNCPCELEGTSFGFQSMGVLFLARVMLCLQRFCIDSTIAAHIAPFNLLCA